MLKKLAVLPLVLAIAACSDSQAPSDAMPIQTPAAVAGQDGPGGVEPRLGQHQEGRPDAGIV